jgi:hypothetical protein
MLVLGPFFISCVEKSCKHCLKNLFCPAIIFGGTSFNGVNFNYRTCYVTFKSCQMKMTTHTLSVCYCLLHRLYFSPDTYESWRHPSDFRNDVKSETHVNTASSAVSHSVDRENKDFDVASHQTSWQIWWVTLWFIPVWCRPQMEWYIVELEWLQS